MGSFCTNVTLVGVDPAAAEPLLVAAARPSFIGSWDGHTVVYDEGGEAQDGSHAELAAELSGTLGCVAVAALVHDDDILYLQVFEDGEVRGEFNSAPDYFDDIPADIPRIGLAAAPGADRWLLGLDPAGFVRLVGAGDVERLTTIAAGDEVFATDLHATMFEELRLPLAACGFGFRALSQGERPADAEAGRLHPIELV